MKVGGRLRTSPASDRCWSGVVVRIIDDDGDDIGGTDETDDRVTVVVKLDADGSLLTIHGLDPGELRRSRLN